MIDNFNSNSVFTVIIPLHEYDEKVAELLNRALVSIPTEDVFEVKIVAPTAVISKIDANSLTVRTSFVDANSLSKFNELVNYGVENVTTPYFSILEYDDEYTKHWFENVKKYIDTNGSDISVFVPMTDIYNFKTDKVYGLANEIPWSVSSVKDELGYIDYQMMDMYGQYNCFFLTGSVFNKTDWETFGGIKDSPVWFWFEFLLRYTRQDLKVFVVPKIGYRHYIEREGSLDYTNSKTYSVEVVKQMYDEIRKESDEIKPFNDNEIDDYMTNINLK